VKRWAALLKGVNVGGNRKLPMADLKAVVAELGFGEVKTLLASGNVVFTAGGDAAAITATLEAALAKHGCKTDILLRDAADLRAIAAANPFEDAARDHPNHLLVLFHREPFPTELLDKIPEIYQGPERLQAVGRELYVDFADNIGDSKLPQAMAKANFPKLNTGRNWNTVNKLALLLEG
jgi:uncharacterized protein (DUF1697 family)